MAAPTESTPAPATRLSGTLGVGSIVFMVVAAAAPLTVIAGTIPLGVGAGNGAAFPATFVLCAVVLLLFAVGFCAMSPHVPDAGAFFTYVRHGLGRPLGMGAAFLALATYTAVQLAVYGYIGAAIDELVTSYGGPSVPWWVWTIAVIAVVAVLGYRHIELSSRVLGVLLLAEIAIVVVLDVVVIVAGGGPEGLSTAAFDPGQIFSGAVGIAIMFAIASFIGFEATAVFRDEARDPQRTIPRATYLALVIIGVFYAVSSWAIVSAWGDEAAVAEAGANPGTFLRVDGDELARPGRRAHRDGPAGDQPVRRDPRVPQRRGALLVRPRRAPGRPGRVRPHPPEPRLAAHRVAHPDRDLRCCSSWCSRWPGSTRSPRSSRGWRAPRRSASSSSW